MKTLDIIVDCIINILKGIGCAAVAICLAKAAYSKGDTPIVLWFGLISFCLCTILQIN